MNLSKSLDQYREEFNLLNYARILNLEILLIEEHGSENINFNEEETFTKLRSSFSRKLIFNKIFNSIIFGILPILPLFAIIESYNILDSDYGVVNDLILGLSLILSIFFIMQFFNYLIMTIIDTSVLMSGRLFPWLRTLPINKKKLQKLVFLTIFKNFDIPIFVIIFSFPIIILIGTQNIIVFFISLGASLINTVLAFNLIIILCGRLNKVLNLNDMSSKKTFFIRIFNILSYILFIFGTIYLIQASITYIGNFFQLFISSTEDSTLVNLILGVIPYPFSLSQLIASVFLLRDFNVHIWITILIGICLLVILSYLVYKRSLKSVYNVVNKDEIYIRSKEFQTIINIKKIKIKIYAPLKAFIIKDIKHLTRDFKSFLSYVTPIILSSVFIVYLNISNIYPNQIFEVRFAYIWFRILIIIPLICGLTIFSISELDSSGKSIIVSLPINQRDLAKSKLILMAPIIIIADLFPILFFINTSSFLLILLIQLLNLPISLIFLFIAFEAKILIFGKKKYKYQVDDVILGKFLYKLEITFLIPYGICILLIMVSNIIILFAGFNYFFLFVLLFLLISTSIISVIFTNIFPKTIEKDSNHIRKNFFMRNINLTIFLIFLLYFSFFILNSLLMRLIPQPFPTVSYTNTNILLLLFYGWYILLFFISNFLMGLLCFYVIPKITHYLGHRTFEEYLDRIGLKGAIQIFENYKIILLLIPTLIISFILINYFRFGDEFMFYFFTSSFESVLIFIFSVWFEILIRGIIFNLFLEKYNKKSSLIRLIILLMIIITINFFIGYVPNIPFINPSIILTMILLGFYYLIYHILLNYLIYKVKNLYTNFLIILILQCLNLPVWVGIIGSDFINYVFYHPLFPYRPW
ncbi:MAG: hypothetical protein EU543_02345 [Promethearchaeota archaeon]|nr:MAG: hypothetical protein EU543_02345 [Candidatus Lokiarchaeota archaeon]